MATAEEESKIMEEGTKGWVEDILRRSNTRRQTISYLDPMNAQLNEYPLSSELSWNFCSEVLEGG